MSLEAVVKIGGSLSRGLGLVPLCRAISRLGKDHRLLLVPGGGGFADQVRESYRRYGLGETAAHHMALLAMDQYGYLLGHLIDDSSMTADLNDACRIAESGRAAILLPSVLINEANPLPHSWRVTSDTIAAWIANRIHCPLLVLLKTVDGLFNSSIEKNSSGKPISEMKVKQLVQHSGGIDEYLSRFLLTAELETWVINGLRPERLAGLLDSGYAIGTRIR